jgi:hypothetical protein
MELIVIKDPSPVWNHIKKYLEDDSRELEHRGKFIGIFDHGFMAGAFLVRPWSKFCYEVHGGVHPEYFGRGVEVCNEVGKLFFCSPCIKIVAPIPEFNVKMIQCVEKIGMKKEGIVKQAFMKNYKAHDIHIYGITKGEYRCLQP